MSRKEQIVVLGGGESGTGAALLAAQKGYAVFLSDSAWLSDAYRSLLIEKGIPFEEGTHTPEKILAADKVIKSPGIPDTTPLIRQLREKGVPVVDELSFALNYTNARVVAITGTNGKTTTTLLTYHLLKEAGLQVGLAGNVGYSLAAQLAEGKTFDWLVLEVSSFQLDSMPGFKPYTGILLNITPDHLDRYAYKFENYVASKLQICKSMTADEALIFNAEDSVLVAALQEQPTEGQLLPVAAAGREAAANLDEEWIRIKGPVRDTLYPHTDIVLRGRHNYLNTACAILAAYRADVTEASIRQSLETFVNAPHRLERVGEVAGVEWINDSKATNVDAAWYALDAMQKPVVWIAGGVDKGNDYDQLETLVRQKVKALICMGKDNEKLLRYFDGVVTKLYDTQSLDEAMRAAQEAAQPGDVVLLAPACASFDLFRNYVDRGDQFRQKVEELKNSR